MTNRKAPDAQSRVIVAVGPTAADPLALAAAARLARAAGAELTALFVEDVNLLRLAELPIAFEISTTSATPRRLAASDVERAFKSQADESRRALIEVASTLRLDLTFEIARGRPERVLLEASGQQDLVVLASAAVRTLTHASAANVIRIALRAPSRGVHARRLQPVSAVLQSVSTAPRMLAAAHTLAQAAAVELILLLDEHAPQGKELSAIVDAWLREHEAAARVTLLSDLIPANVAKLIANEGSHALFWPGDGEPDIAAEIDALLEAISCPLILVR